jgi:autotransporter-associated beta strand protein
MEWTALTSRLTASIAFAVCLLALTDRADAGSCSWTGAAHNNKWSVAANWTGATCVSRAPQNGDDLQFPNGVFVHATQNDLVNLQIGQIDIFASGYVLDGNRLTLTGEVFFDSLENDMTFTAGIEMPLTLGGNARIVNDNPSGSSVMEVRDVALTGFQLIFDLFTKDQPVVKGAITGNGKVVKTGFGVLSVTGTNTYTGPTQVFEGTLSVVNSAGLGASGPGNETTVLDKASLAFPADNLTINESLIIQGSGFNGIGAILTNGGTGSTLAGPITFPQSALIAVSLTRTLTVTGRVTGGAGENSGDGRIPTL